MVGLRAAQVVDELITIGERGRMIASAARKAGLSHEAVVELDGNQDAILYLKNRLGTEDIVLVKGSRGMQMEEIVEALEADQ